MEAILLASAMFMGLGLSSQPATQELSQDQKMAALSHSIKNWGLSSHPQTADIHALDAWKLQEGNAAVIVAVIDTGLDPTHPDLKENLWHDPTQKQANIWGWDFVNHSPNPMDLHGHGTHVAGIIGAKPDPVSGVSGVAHHISLMPLKYYSEHSSGHVNLKNTIAAIHYAMDHGAKIINYSGGGSEFSKAEYQAIEEAESRGILFVAAAGNEHQNTDQAGNSYYPSAYNLKNILSVAATDAQNHLISSSNWGPHTVDVAAPGKNILSTLPHARAGEMSGTSQATAFVSGLAALLLSENPKLTATELKAAILASVDHFPELEGKVQSGGRINACAALMRVHPPLQTALSLLRLLSQSDSNP